MSSPASFKGHPFHPIIIPLPIGLWIFSLISDLIFKFGYGGPVWNDVVFYTLAGGIVGALIATLPGFIDLTGPIGCNRGTDPTRLDREKIGGHHA